MDFSLSLLVVLICAHCTPDWRAQRPKRGLVVSPEQQNGAALFQTSRYD
jgi:hypothetical protein